MPKALTQYLKRYACPEITLAEGIAESYSHVLVVPVLAESVSFIQGLLAALGKDALLVCVVNNRADASEEQKQRNQELLTELAQARFDNGILVVDRASPGRELPPKQGVGLARRIGCDIACRLIDQGRIASPWIHTSDGDATLPPEYFAAASESEARDAAALSYPFRHERGDDKLAHAHALYEVSLRHYVYNLRRAGSPYAHHSIGSTIAIRASVYAAVRGMPKRLAGEDFYLLNKAAKLGPIVTPRCSPIELKSRRSARAPFGTGPAVNALLSEALTLYNPRSYELLAEWLRILDKLAESGVSKLPPLGPKLALAMPRESTEEAVSKAMNDIKTPSQRRRRLHDWFDGLRTLQLIHRLRDEAGLVDLPWPTALATQGIANGSPLDALDDLVDRGC